MLDKYEGALITDKWAKELADLEKAIEVKSGLAYKMLLADWNGVKLWEHNSYTTTLLTNSFYFVKQENLVPNLKSLFTQNSVH